MALLRRVVRALGFLVGRRSSRAGASASPAICARPRRSSARARASRRARSSPRSGSSPPASPTRCGTRSRSCARPRRASRRTRGERRRAPRVPFIARDRPAGEVTARSSPSRGRCASTRARSRWRALRRAEAAASRSRCARRAGASTRATPGRGAAELDADPDLVCQVLLGLLANAAEAAPGAAASRSRRARPATDGARRCADNGPGVAAADRARIFEPFFTTRRDGTGSASPIARQIVEAHGGRIEVGERRGGGARFTVVCRRRAARRRRHRRSPMKPRILVVDDEARMATRARWRSGGRATSARRCATAPRRSRALESAARRRRRHRLEDAGHGRHRAAARR